MQIKTNIFKTLVRVSVEMVSISDSMAVFLSEIMCAFLTLYPYITPTENNCENLSPARMVAVKILPRTAQCTGLQGFLRENIMKKAKHGIASVRSGTILLRPS
jgi:hypothetical protein